ncbi:RNA-binding protein 4.1 isoform X1 [Hydra vulgaris]|uniref:RNA-binding protein 4 n=2 Tax=Hydra vulgaris TaxID=6087 RepID=T2M6P4_HYDVU|nr:RNA-binding protein 4.1-like isoform X1 [Hydra vulgaris]
MPQENGIDDKTIKLYIGGIDPSWSNEKVTEILSKYGKVKRTDVVKNYAFAFVENKDEATNIINGASGTITDGFKIVVQISKNKQNLPEGDDLCFECGKGGHWAKECSQRRARLEGRRGHTGPIRGRDPYSNSRERFNGPPQIPNRNTYLRDSYPRNPYTRDAYYRDPYACDMYSRDLYSHDPYLSRDPYCPDPYGSEYELDRYSVIGRSRSPILRSPYIRPVDPYAVAREKLAYGDVSRIDPYTIRRDPYDTIPSDPYALASTRRMDVYERDPRRVENFERDRYATAAGPADKRYPEPAHPANVDYR